MIPAIAIISISFDYQCRPPASEGEQQLYSSMEYSHCQWTSWRNRRARLLLRCYRFHSTRLVIW